jgi:phage terminase small subunit
MKAVPIETIILGAQSKQGIKLTKKQKEFAEAVVATGNKTEAYRRTHNTNGKRTTASPSANKLSKKPNVATYIMALEAQKEVEEYLLPPRLRAMAIHKLSSMALNDDLPPAQQLKALELVGKMTEVSLFTERRELVHTLDASSLKDKLMEAVQLAIHNSKFLHMKTKRSAEQLLKEISLETEVTDVAYIDAEKDIGTLEETVIDSDSNSTSNSSIPDPSILPISDPPPSATTPFLAVRDAGHLHSISHKESPSNLTLTPVTVTNPLESDTCEKLSINPSDLIPMGEGVSKILWTEKESTVEPPPSKFSNQKG